MTVLTRNPFSGADLRPAYADPERLAELPGAVVGIFNRAPPDIVQRTNVPARAIAIANEMEATQSDVIGLHAAAEWRTREPGKPGHTVVTDHLEIFKAELERLRDVHGESLLAPAVAGPRWSVRASSPASPAACASRAAILPSRHSASKSRAAPSSAKCRVPWRPASDQRTTQRLRLESNWTLITPRSWGRHSLPHRL